MRESVSVCFVCLGNICRSPTAEGVFRALVEADGLSDRIAIDSAGTAAYHSGQSADRRSRMFARQRGIELDSIARQFVKEDFDRFDYVLALDLQNLSELRDLRGDEFARETHLGLLRDFDPTAASGSSVPDPYYGGEAGFLEVFEQCQRACQGLLQYLKTQVLADASPR